MSEETETGLNELESGEIKPKSVRGQHVTKNEDEKQPTAADIINNPVTYQPFIWNTNTNAATSTISIDGTALRQGMLNLGQRAHEAQLSINQLTEAAGPTNLNEKVQSIDEDLSTLSDDLSVLRGEFEEQKQFESMTQKVAIAALVLQLGGQPTDITAITKVMMELMPNKSMEETSMEEFVAVMDDAITKFYRDRQQNP